MNCQSIHLILRSGTVPLFLSLMLLYFSNCADPTAPPLPESTPGSRLHYSVSIPGFSQDSVRIAVEIVEEAFPCTLLLPPIYADNPIDSLTSPLFRDLSVTDADSQALPYRIMSFPIGPIESPGVIIGRTDALPVTVRYRLQFSALQDSTRSRQKLTFLNQNEGYLQGNYLFAAPFETTLPDLWRTPRSLHVSFSLVPTTELYGIERSGQSFANAYELLFLQIILGGTELYRGTAADQEFLFHAFSQSLPDKKTISSRASAFESILGDIVNTYGSLYHSTYTVTMHNIQGGLEGTNSFVMSPFHTNAYYSDVMVLAHEALHNFIGIECGDHDDPWWKEGTTFYLGYVVPVSNGFIPVDTLHNKFVTDLSSNSGVNQYAPSSDRLRDDLFHKWLIEVAYTKGGQIAMLLDDALHQATDNKVGLYRFTARMVRRCSDGIFTRNKLIAEFAAYDAANSAVTILHEYADRPGAIPLDTLESAYGRLLQAGAFDPPDNKMSKRNTMTTASLRSIRKAGNPIPSDRASTGAFSAPQFTSSVFDRL